MSVAHRTLLKELSLFGVSEESAKFFDKPGHEVIAYLDLLSLANDEKALETSIRPDAVIETNNEPLLYVVSSTNLAQDITLKNKQLTELKKNLACRSDAQLLAVVHHGQIDVYPVSLSKNELTPFVVKESDKEAKTFVADLAMGEMPNKLQSLVPSKKRSKSQHLAVHELLLELLSVVTEDLLKNESLREQHEDVLSLVGRALFTRFLIDRSIINPKTFPELYKNASPENAFGDTETSVITCNWLDETFNGELLPLSSNNYSSFFKRLSKSNYCIFKALSKILYRTTATGQMHLDWGDINFAHVPVGLLSQVYERYAHKFFKDTAENQSIHYTPRNIAEFMVEQAFPGVTTSDTDKVKLLDPSCGAGVFLVIALRKLVEERWKATGIRPNTRQIRSILMKQIRGFDINPSALKLAALALYLTALELDPNPQPPTDLKFEKLIGNILIDTCEHNEDRPHFGSLDVASTQGHENQYDLVIGNPPWTGWGMKHNKVFKEQTTSLIRKIIKIRDKSGALLDLSSGYTNPDNIPDLPFVWRSMEWAKPNATMSFVLHGRLLFKRADSGSDAREALFRSLRVTGILNGADIIKIWPTLTQPFCVLFAKNHLPNKNDLFHFVSPALDRNIDKTPRLRVDYQASTPIKLSSVVSSPSLFKTIYRGTSLDADIIQRLNSMMKPAVIEEYDDEDNVLHKEQPTLAYPLGKYWKSLENISCGQGYQNGTAKDASKILELKGKDFRSENKVSLLINEKNLKDFSKEKLNRTRVTEIYQPPLVLISEGPGESRENYRAMLSFSKKPIIYSESFYGFSGANHPNGKNLVSYLFLLSNSDLFIYYQLMTSSKFGVERRAYLEEDVHSFPVIPYEKLPKKDRGKIADLVEDMINSKTPSWSKLNKWVFSLYDISNADKQVIEDTLQTRMPYKTSINRSIQAPSNGLKNSFVKELKDTLNPFFEITDEHIDVTLHYENSSAWSFIDIVSSVAENEISQVDYLKKIFSELGKKANATRIFVERGQGYLTVCLLNEYRYWTKTRARICALDILKQRGDVFKVNKQ